MARAAEFAHGDDVERRIQRGGDHGRDRHSASGEAEHHGRLRRPWCLHQHRGELPTSVGPVFE
ncbi:hypothetical protein GCM10027029_21660 [Conyzicola lurida]